MNKRTLGLKPIYLLILVLVFLISFTLIAGCSTSASPTPSTTTKLAATPTPTLTPQKGGILKVGEQQDGVSIGYPAKITRYGSIRQAAPAIETLLRLDSTGKPVPWLATGYKEDTVNKTITLTLRQGVKFHDGTDFNAQAVKWNLEQCVANNVTGTNQIKSIDVVDNYTVRINLNEWDSTVTGNFSLVLGMMISPSACQKNGVDWAANNPVGTGPFKFVSWQKDTKTVYTRFDGYWQKDQPYLDEIDWVIINDNTTRALSFRGKDVDVILTLDQKTGAGLKQDGFIVYSETSGANSAALIPSAADTHSPWNNLKVRQAAQYSIDSGGIVSSLLYGFGEATNQFTYKANWAYNPSIVGYPYNPAKAKQLLTDAGYPNGFTTQIIYLSSDFYNQLYAAVQSNLKDIGINAALTVVQAAGYDGYTKQGKTWDGLLKNTSPPNPDIVASLLAAYAGLGPNNVSMALPDDYIQTIKKAAAAADFATKQQLAQQAVKLISDNCLQIILYAGSEVAATQTNVKNTGFLSSPNTIQWTPETAWINK